jgi:hypothetical protein
MAHIDIEPVVEMVKKHFPIHNPEGSPLFERIVDVCFFAGYYESDIEELCSSLSDFSDAAFQRGIDTVKSGL